jgi:hypothetical protein
MHLSYAHSHPIRVERPVYGLDASSPLHNYASRDLILFSPSSLRRPRKKRINNHHAQDAEVHESLVFFVVSGPSMQRRLDCQRRNDHS